MQSRENYRQVIQLSQEKLLELIQQYNSTDRTIIRKNLKMLMIKKDFTIEDMVNMGYNKNTVYSWTKPSQSNIPMIEDALKLAIQFNFDITDLLKEIE
jgi:hypothetical protein